MSGPSEAAGAHEIAPRGDLRPPPTSRWWMQKLQLPQWIPALPTSNGNANAGGTVRRRKTKINFGRRA